MVYVEVALWMYGQGVSLKVKSSDFVRTPN